jgi:hypothetical protein
LIFNSAKSSHELNPQRAGDYRPAKSTSGGTKLSLKYVNQQVEETINLAEHMEQEIHNKTITIQIKRGKQVYLQNYTPLTLKFTPLYSRPFPFFLTEREKTLIFEIK